MSRLYGYFLAAWKCYAADEVTLTNAVTKGLITDAEKKQIMDTAQNA